MTKGSRLTPDQKAVGDKIRPHEAEPSGGQTPEQAVNLAVLSFLYWCAFHSLDPQPTEETVRAAFESAGMPELAPPERLLGRPAPRSQPRLKLVSEGIRRLGAEEQTAGHSRDEPHC